MRKFLNLSSDVVEFYELSLYFSSGTTFMSFIDFFERRVTGIATVIMSYLSPEVLHLYVY